MEKRDTRVMMDLSGFKMDWIEKWCPLLTIAFACFVLHGMILLNERPFWDGLLIYHLERTGNWPELYRWFSECGIPSSALIHWAIGGWTSNPILAYRIVTFLSLLTISLSFYGICRFFGLSRGTGVQLAVLSLAIPVCQISEEVILSLNYLLIAVFFLSALWRFSLSARLARSGEFYGGQSGGFLSLFHDRIAHNLLSGVSSVVLRHSSPESGESRFSWNRLLCADAPSEPRLRPDRRRVFCSAVTLLPALWEFQNL
jgi:hypothetical protein